MQIQFRLNFQTLWGQSIYLQLYTDEQQFVRHEMKCENTNLWIVNVHFEDNPGEINYRYSILKQDKTFENEFGNLRKVLIPAKQQFIAIEDNRRIPNGDSAFNTVAFTDCFFKRKKTTKNPQSENINFVLRINCPQMEPDRHFAIIGNQSVLGSWDVSRKIRLNESNFPFWSVALNIKDITFPLEYKYLIVDTKTDEVLAWGGGPNRRVENAEMGKFTIVTDENFIRTIPSWKTAGVAIPVFSLRSEEGFGIGELLDLKKMVDWAKQTGQHIIQTLPINDTILNHTNYDSYPYNAVSVYALHPVYLRLERLGTLKYKQDIAYFENIKKKLNENSFSDYQNVLNEKWKYFKLIYPKESPAVFTSDDYKQFFEANKTWLVPYAVFSYLRDKNGTPKFGKWNEFNTYKQNEIEAFASEGTPYYDEIALFYFLQYHLHKQLVEVHEYARSKGVVLKSDIPIGVSPRSVDAWVEPQLFNTNMQAGAPPDDFSVTGQNWGFPTYNWDEMAKDGYRWWQNRFRKFMEYFDAYRIDHILGFFRIWEIPEKDVWALTGNFSPALPFSVQDLQTRGLWWDENRYLRPYLREHVVRAVFGKYADDVMHEYLLTDGWQNFKFKPEYDTQKKIEAHFAALGYNFTTKEVAIRDGLYALHCEVLFVRDKEYHNLFHPRISMHSSQTFKDLQDDTRKILDRIYVEYFYHRHTEFWKEQALKKLPALLAATNMLVCGEDLGMVPDSVPEVINRLEILSLEIQRMPKKPNTEFAMPADAPYLSVCTTSTHDMSPIRAWWEEDAAITQRFYNHALCINGPAPEVCTPFIAEKIVEQHLKSSAMLVILPWQDWMSMDEKLRYKYPNAERINVPSNPRNFWCYRMHLTLEKLLSEKKLNVKIKKLIEVSGR